MHAAHGSLSQPSFRAADLPLLLHLPPTCCPAVLQSLSAELRSLQLELADCRSQLEAKDDALAAAGAETSNMHKVRPSGCGMQRPTSAAIT